MILCCGEALIDMLPRRTAAGDEAFMPLPGGAVFNSAIALGRLGIPTGFFSGLSSDLFGQKLRDALVASHVETGLAIISDKPTTLAFVSIAEGQASYVFYDEQTAGRTIRASDLPLLDARVRAMLFGGISLISEPCGTAYEALMMREADSRVVMFDPNIRAAFISDRAAHGSRMRRMIASSDIIKVSDDDLAWFGETGSHEAIARRWLKIGPKLVVITRGGEGVCAFTDELTVQVPARRVEVADTVGAGDTFNAGLLAALFEAGLLEKSALGQIGEMILRQALEFAVSAAAVTVSRAGANPPWRHELRSGDFG